MILSASCLADVLALNQKISNKEKRKLFSDIKNNLISVLVISLLTVITMSAYSSYQKNLNELRGVSCYIIPAQEQMVVKDNHHRYLDNHSKNHREVGGHSQPCIIVEIFTQNPLIKNKLTARELSKLQEMKNPSEAGGHSQPVMILFNSVT